MTKKKKVLVVSIAAIPVIVIVALVAVFLSLNSIVRTAVETVGPQITGTDVRLAKVDISPFSGRVILEGMFIGSPAGFKAPSVFELNKITVGLEPRSVLTDTIVIDEIVVVAPKITFEGQMSGSNIGALLDNVESFTGGGTTEEQPAAPAQPQESKPTSAGGGKKVIINRFVLKGAEVTLAATMLGGKGVTLPLPDIELTDIGKKSNGATAQEVVRQVLASINEAVMKAVSSSDALLKGGIDTVKDMGKGLGDAAKGISESAKSVGNAAEQSASKILEPVKGLGELFKK